MSNDKNRKQQIYDLAKNFGFDLQSYKSGERRTYHLYSGTKICTGTLKEIEFFLKGYEMACDVWAKDQ